MRLLLRHFTSSVGASILVAVIVLAVTLITALVPRAVAAMSTAELRYQVADLAPEVRDAVAESIGSIPTVRSDADPYAVMDDALDSLRAETPPELRTILGDPDYLSRTEALPIPAADPARDAPLTLTRLAFDPRIEERVTIVEGEFPASLESDLSLQPNAEAFPVMLSVESADAMRWSVGEQRRSGSFTLVLSGTFEAVDDSDRYWRHAASVLQPEVFDDGNTTPKVTATAYANPLSIYFDSSSRVVVWYPIDTDDLDFQDAATIAPQLRAFTATPYPLPLGDDSRPLTLRFESQTVDLLDSVLSRASATISVLAMIASGPLGVVLAVFALGARSVIERRRAAFTLASARGASVLQLRSAAALEGLVLGAIPAAIGIIAATALLPARVGADAFLAPLLLGLAPAVLFAASASSQGLRTTRADLGSTSPGRRRWIVEVLVLALAGLAVFLLMRRGLATSATAIGVDPLLAATPLLLSLAACVIALRVYPLPLARLTRRLHRGTGLIGFLGSARAVRDRSLALAAVLALVVGVSVSVFSSVLLTTLDRGVAAGAAAAVGADLRVEGPVFDEDQVAAASELRGVAAVTGIDVAAPAALRIDKVRTTIALFVADTQTLTDIRDDLPAGLTTLDGDAVPIVVSSDLADELDPDAELLIDGQPVVVAGVADRTTGFGETRTWAIVDRAFAEQLTGTRYLPRLLLIDTAAGTDAAALTPSLTELGGAGTTVTSLDQAIARAGASPTTSGFRLALLLAVLAITLLAALAVVMSSSIGADSRNRTIALLRTLGMTTRQSSGLIAWELAPLAFVALVAGTALGLIVPWIVLAGVDLRPFTNGATQPPPAIDPLLLAAVLGGVVVAVIAAALVSIVVGRRLSPATTLRMGAE